MKPDNANRLNRIAQISKTLVGSLTFRCLACVVAYAVIIIVLFVSAYSLSEQKLDNAFPTLEKIQEKDDALGQDRFEVIKSSLPSSCQLIVFDGSGRALYSSDAYVAEHISAQDLAIISESEEGRTYYEVFSTEDAQGLPAYTVLLCSADEEENVKTVLGSCLLNGNLQIEDGTLFSDRSALSEREFSLIKGLFESRMDIQKLEYRTDDGEARTLVLVSPFMTESTYDAAIAEANRIWLFVTPIALALTVAMALTVAHLTRRAMRPLDIAIESRQSGTAPEAETETLPLELRSTFTRFENLMEQLDESEADKRRIIADISHDLKTPLTVIRGYAQAFEDGRVPDHKREQYLHAMNRKSQEASELIESLFAFAKMEHPSFAPSLQRRDLTQIIQAIASDELAGVEQAGCSLVLDVCDGPVYADVDEDLIRRAVGNLVSNARTHNPCGTVIALTCKTEREKALVSVSDDGVGVPSQIRDTMFGAFVTGDDARKSGSGTGLGLAIASRCAQLNGATLSLSEDPAQPFVTEFIIEIPLSRNSIT